MDHNQKKIFCCYNCTRIYEVYLFLVRCHFFFPEKIEERERAARCGKKTLVYRSHKLSQKQSPHSLEITKDHWREEKTCKNGQWVGKNNDKARMLTTSCGARNGCEFVKWGKWRNSMNIHVWRMSTAQRVISDSSASIGCRQRSQINSIILLFLTEIIAGNCSSHAKIKYYY